MDELTPVMVESPAHLPRYDPAVKSCRKMVCSKEMPARVLGGQALSVDNYFDHYLH